LPRLEKRFCGAFHSRFAAIPFRLLLKRFVTARTLSQDAGEEKHFVIASGVGMQLRQKQTPHASIFQRIDLADTPCSTHG